MRLSAYISYPFFSNISKIPLIVPALPFSENVIVSTEKQNGRLCVKSNDFTICSLYLSASTEIEVGRLIEVFLQNRVDSSQRDSQGRDQAVMSCPLQLFDIRL